MRELINEKELLADVRKHKASIVCEKLSTALEKGELKPEDFSIRALWNALVVEKKTGEPCGERILNEHGDGTSMARWIKEEGAGFVGADSFSAIGNQIIYSKIIKTYAEAAMPLSKLFQVIPSNFTRGERWAGLSRSEAIVDELAPGQEIPSVSPVANWTDSTAQQKRAEKVLLSRESLIQDRSGELLQMAKTVALSLAQVQEYTAACTLADLSYTVTVAGGRSVTLNPGRSTTGKRYGYMWKDTQFSNFESSASPGDWVNLKTANALTDHENVNQANILLDSVKDPFTGFPLAHPASPPKLICTQYKVATANRIARATTEYRGAGSSANFASMVSQGPFAVEFEVVKSRHLADVLSANSADTGTWYFGYPEEAFAFARHMDFEVQEMPPGSGISWSHDIAMGWRVINFETPFTWDPRFIVRNDIS